MNNEAVVKLKRMVTPEVSVESCSDAPYGIHAQVKHTYHFPHPAAGEQTITWSKTFTVLADKDGNVFSAPGALN